MNRTAGGGGEGGRRARKGHFVVYVGEEMWRCVLPTAYLKNPCMQKLLDEAAEEFGFGSPRILLPCDKRTFLRMLRPPSLLRMHARLVHRIYKRIP